MPPTKLGAGTNVGDRPYWNGTSWTSQDIKHALLSAIHSDTETETPVAGDIIIANALAKWSRLAKGNNDEVLTLDSGLPKWKSAAGGIHGAELHTGDIIPSADQDFGGYRLKGLKRMTSVPSAADIGTDGIVLTEIAGTPGEKNLGYQTDGTSDSSANYLVGQRWQMPEDGTITKVLIYSRVTGNAKLGIYEDSAGEMGALLSGPIAIACSAGAWNTATLTTTVARTSGAYFWTTSNTDTLAVRRGTGTGTATVRYKVLAYANAWPDPAGSGYTSDDDDYALYVKYTVPAFTRRLYVNVNGTVAYSTLT
jgi:hypothetical protein